MQAYYRNLKVSQSTSGLSFMQHLPLPIHKEALTLLQRYLKHSVTLEFPKTATSGLKLVRM